MVFSSTVFLFIFLPAVLIIYYNPLIKSRNFKNVFLLIASLAFYAWGEPVFVLLMCLSVLVTYMIGNLICRNNSKKWLAAGIIYHITVLFIFKYLTFFLSEMGLLFGFKSSVQLELPIGISFFTFQMMSYLFDVYYGKAEPQRNPLNVGLYVSLFPQLIAGPIVRYEQISSEITSRKESFEDLIEGMKRFIYGLGKKVLIANYVALIADNIFDYIEVRSVALVWLGAVAYTLQIYFDFSGYSDMAIGLGRMFGFHFLENFNYPYIAHSVTDFWRRWHISLSSWFRDYVYIPLGGNRVSRSRWIMNLLTVWLLTGIWHGANWTFLIWGLFYFVVLLFEKLSGTDKRKSIISRLYTLFAVICAWVIFRSPDLSSGIRYLGNMFGVGASGIADATFFEYIGNTYIVLIIAVIGATPLVRAVFNKLGKVKMAWIEDVWLAAVFVLAILKTVNSTYNPFIYFNF